MSKKANNSMPRKTRMNREELSSEALQLLDTLRVTPDHRKRILIIETLKEFKVSTALIAQQTGLQDYQVRHYRRVYQHLVPEVMALFERGLIHYSLARALASLPPKEQEKAARTAIAKHVSVHAFRASRKTNNDPRLTADLEKLANRYSEHSGLDIRIQADAQNPKAGQWIIRYASLDMFDAIVEKVVGSLDELY